MDLPRLRLGLLAVRIGLLALCASCDPEHYDHALGSVPLSRALWHCSASTAPPGEHLLMASARSETRTEQIRSLGLRAFALEFCNAPVQEGETREEAMESIAKAARELANGS